MADGPKSVARPARQGGLGRPCSCQSLFGLNAVNFFLAEAAGVVVPFLDTFLRARHWSYDAIAIPTALAGLGVLLMQTPGLLVDRGGRQRAMLAAASIGMGVCYGLLPLVPSGGCWVDPLLFIAGVSQAFFVPLLGALALGLAGHAALNRTMGANQAWNHAGNIASALIAMLLIAWFTLSSTFYAVTVVSMLAAASLLFIRANEVDPLRASGLKTEGSHQERRVSLRVLFHDRRIVVLFIAVALFHLSNAPILPTVGLYIKHLGGGNRQVAGAVLVAQVVMVPVAWATGWLCERWGRKPAFAIGFLILPLRIFLYSLTRNPGSLVALQALDGIGAGIYGVAIVAVGADLTRGKGRFNSLMGVMATALSLGGVIGPLAAGYLVQHLGFASAFHAFAGLATVAAAVFVFLMPETRPSQILRPGAFATRGCAPARVG